MPNCQPDIRIIWGDDTGISNLSCCKAVSWAIAGPTSTESPQKASDSPTGTQPSGARRSGHREGRRRLDAAGVGRRSDRRRTQACHAAPTTGRSSCGIARR